MATGLSGIVNVAVLVLALFMFDAVFLHRLLSTVVMPMEQLLVAKDSPSPQRMPGTQSEKLSSILKHKFAVHVLCLLPTGHITGSVALAKIKLSGCRPTLLFHAQRGTFD